MKYGLILPLALAFALTISTCAFAQAAGGFLGVTAKVTVKARAEKIYETIRSLRNDEESGVTEIARTATEATLEERFDGLPIIGHAKCVYIERYSPPERIEYKMVHSDRFKAFEGKWEIVPVGGGDVCVLSLSSYVDTGLPIPFARQITNAATMRDVEQRLSEVKQKAETLRREVSTRSPGQANR